MFLCVNLGWVTTFRVKIGWFLGLGDTFDFFECIRDADTTELYRVSIYRSAIYYIKLGLMQGVKHFYLTDTLIFKLQKCRKYKLHKKYTVILYYYNIFFRAKGGVVYILEQVFDCRKGHISSIHTSTTILSSIPSSVKPWKINIFTIFYIAKNH